MVEESQKHYLMVDTHERKDMETNQGNMLTWSMQIEEESILGDSPMMVQPLQMLPWSTTEYKQELGEGHRDAERMMDEWMEENEATQEDNNRESDKEEAIQSKQWSVPKKKARKVARPCKPTRQSSRIPKDGITVSEKAERRVEALNNTIGNSFALFNLVDNKYLESLAVDPMLV